MLGERIHRLPPFRSRIVRVPGDIHHPVAFEDPDFDLDFHVRRIAVPSPGGLRELCEIVSHIVGRPLDRSKPLWEIYLAEGLAGGRVASIAKVHHTLADGVASAELLDLFNDESPEPGPVPMPPKPSEGSDPCAAQAFRHAPPEVVEAGTWSVAAWSSPNT